MSRVDDWRRGQELSVHSTTLRDWVRCYKHDGESAFTGLFDQTSKSYIPNYPLISMDFKNDNAFVNDIEKRLPLHSKIFQFPYVPFPESPPINNMADYELFRGYLHSNNLQWSYGAMRGRESDLWQKWTTSMSIEDQLLNISFFWLF